MADTSACLEHSAENDAQHDIMHKLSDVLLLEEVQPKA